MPDLKMYSKPTKEFAYFLGFLWGDGYLNDCHTISCDILLEDAKNIHYLFVSFGFNKWKDTEASDKSDKNGRIVHRRRQRRYRLTDWTFEEFLTSMNYRTKNLSPNKILDWLPKSLVRYWILGLFDADGCFYTNQKHRLFQCALAGPFDQEWTWLQTILNNLNISSKIKRTVWKTGYKGSVLRWTGQDNYRLFANYLYPDGYEFGLKRKYQKSLEMKKILDFYKKNPPIKKSRKVRSIPSPRDSVTGRYTKEISSVVSA